MAAGPSGSWVVLPVVRTKIRINDGRISIDKGSLEHFQRDVLVGFRHTDSPCCFRSVCLLVGAGLVNARVAVVRAPFEQDLQSLAGKIGLAGLAAGLTMVGRTTTGLISLE